MGDAVIARTERINLRLDPNAKRKLEKAASVSGRSVSRFIIESALESAEETIRAEETMTLSARDTDLFFDAILDPPRPNAKLRRATKDYRDRVEPR
jgi:uncharacterized protein (DUF1778 family)